MRYMLVALLPLAGCTGAVVANQDLQTYSPTLAHYAFANGGMGVVVQGGSPRPANAIVAAVRPPAWASYGNMVPASANGVASAYRVVLTFSPAFPGTGTDAVCTAPLAPLRQASADQPVDIAATFCVFDRARSAVRASLPPPSAPTFAASLGNVVDALLPAYDPNVTHDGSCFGPGC